MGWLARLLAMCGVCAVLAAASASAATPPAPAPGSSADGYPPTTHFETSCANKCELGRGGSAISHVVFLSSEGGKDSTIATEQFDQGKSIHYFAANDGSVGDFVPEADTAWYAGDATYNQTSIGIIVEGFVSTPSSFGDLEYQRAAQLTGAIAHRYGFPIDADHVLGRGDIGTSLYAGTGPDPSLDLVRLRSLAQAYRDELEPPAITGSAPPSATAGSAYSFQYSASSNGPVTFGVSSGALPDGLVLSDSGALAGTPTTAGTFTFTVTVSRPSGVSASRTDTIVVAPAPAEATTGVEQQPPPPSVSIARTAIGGGGRVVVTVTASGPGTLTVTVTVPTASVARAGKCARGRIRIKGRCRPKETVVGSARASVEGGRPVTLTVRPRGAALTALKRGRRLHALARVVYRPAAGGSPLVATRRVTLHR